MRLSYLRYALKTTSDPRGLLERGTEEVHLSPKFQSLLEPFVPAVAVRCRHNPNLEFIGRADDPGAVGEQ